MSPEDIVPLYRLYHKNQHDFVDPDAVDGGGEWATGGYKEYTRLSAVEPPESVDHEDDAVLRALRSRESFTDATTTRPVTRAELFTILRCAYRVDPALETRPVASAGQLYPLELYPLVLDSPDLDSGLYHYNPARDVLERPADPEYVERNFGPFETFVGDNWSHLDVDDEISAMILVTGIPSRSAVKYGERGYLFTLVEAGELLHAMQLAAAHLDIGSRPYAGFRYDAVASLLGTASDPREWVVVSLALASPG